MALYFSGKSGGFGRDLQLIEPSEKGCTCDGSERIARDCTATRDKFEKLWWRHEYRVDVGYFWRLSFPHG